MPRSARPDPIRIVEAAYRWQPNEAHWLDEIVRATSPYEVGGGVIGCTVRVGERTTIDSLRKTELASDAAAQALVQVTEHFPPKVASEVLAPTEFVGNAAYRLSRIAATTGGDAATLVRRSRAQLPPVWVLLAGDPHRRSLMLCFPRPFGSASSKDDPYPHRDSRSLGLVGAHIAAALRIRAIVRPTSGDADTEAILSPGGKLLHATGAAQETNAQTSLAAAVRASETARGRLRRTSPEEAIALWKALVQGRWTILDCVERDGKRLLLARKNPLSDAGLLDLTTSERDVAWLAARGHSYRYIAYELGIPLSTASGRLRRAMRKLRVGSRTELLQKLGSTPR